MKTKINSRIISLYGNFGTILFDAFRHPFSDQGCLNPLSRLGDIFNNPEYMDHIENHIKGCLPKLMLKITQLDGEYRYIDFESIMQATDDLEPRYIHSSADKRIFYRDKLTEGYRISLPTGLILKGYTKCFEDKMKNISINAIGFSYFRIENSSSYLIQGSKQGKSHVVIPKRFLSDICKLRAASDVLEPLSAPGYFYNLGVRN